MSLNIQTTNGLKKISNDITKEKLIGALGYTPADETQIAKLEADITAHTENTDVHVTTEDRERWDNKSDFSGSYKDLTDQPNIIDDESGEYVITDADGNVIFQVDAEGAHTTALSLNGKDVNTLLTGIDANIAAHTENADIHVSAEDKEKLNNAHSHITDTDVHVTSEDKEKLNTSYSHTENTEIHVSAEEKQSWTSASADIESHLDDTSGLHVSAEDRERWDNKSDFSGSYKDLTDQPNIIDDESGEYVITDADGNVIFQVDAEGAHTTALSLNGEDVGTLFTSIEANITAHTENADIHVSAEDKEKWDATHDHTENTDIHVTADDKEKLNSFNSHIDNTDVHVTAEDKQNWTSAVADIESHIDDTSGLHVSTEDRERWDNKSDFSGSYKDLTDQPNIIDDESGEYVITDADGNVIFQVDAEGAHTTALSLNGDDVNTLLTGIEANITAHTENSDIHVSTEDKEKLNTAYSHTENADIHMSVEDKETLNNVQSHTENAEIHVSAIEKQAWTSASADIESHIDDTSGLHVSTEDRERWDNKSDFSGSYKDLTDQPNIIDDESGEYVITDADGNVIFQVDAEGAHTTALYLNGEDVGTLFTGIEANITAHTENADIHVSAEDKEKLDSVYSHTENTDIHVSTEDKEKWDNTYTHTENTEIHITTEERQAWTSASADIESHVENTDVHVTTEDRERWDNKSDFSGSYKDLTDQPNIIDDESGEYVITDADGNVIFQVDAEGAHTTALSLNGEDVGTLFTGVEANITAHTENTDIHVSAGDKEKWDATHAHTENSDIHITTEDREALSGVQSHVDNTEIHVSTEEKQSWTSASADIESHVENTDVHVTTEDRERWDNKSDFSGSYKDLTDQPNIIDDESGEYVITDADGNVIFQVDSEGAHTTALSLNGEDVGTLFTGIEANITAHTENADIHITTDDKEKLDSIKSHTENTDVHVTAEDKEKLDSIKSHTENADIHVSAEEKQAWTSASADIESHIDDTSGLHVSTEDRERWDNKSDFSGSYKDLTDQPNIIDDESGEYVITDADGNVIFQVDAEGAHTTALTLNGEDVNTLLTGIEADIAAHTENADIHVTTEDRERWDNKSDFSGSYKDLTDQPNIIDDESGEYVITDADGNVIFQVDAEGAHTTALSLNGEDVGTLFTGIEADIAAHTENADIHVTETDKVNINTAYAHTENTDVHVTAEDKEKLNTVQSHVDNADIHVTVEDKQSWTSASADIESHLDDTSGLHVTTEDRERWDNKSDFSGSYKDLTDQPNIIDDESGEYVITDADGNVIVQVDAEGIHTTAVSLNGEDVGTLLAGVEADIAAHIENNDVHVTTNDRERWDNKSDFSGSYKDLTDRPNIIDDESGEYVITDANGNVIFQVDAEGAHTTALSLNGDDVGTLLTGVEADIAAHTENADIHVNAEDKEKWDNKSDFSGSYKDLTDQPNIIDDESGEYVITDADGNVIVQVDTEGVHTTAMSLNGEDMSTVLTGIEADITAHTENTNIHVSEEEKDAWNSSRLVVQETKPSFACAWFRVKS